MVKCKEQVELMTSGKEAQSAFPRNTGHFCVHSQVISVFFLLYSLRSILPILLTLGFDKGHTPLFLLACIRACVCTVKCIPVVFPIAETEFTQN